MKPPKVLWVCPDWVDVTPHIGVNGKLFLLYCRPCKSSQRFPGPAGCLGPVKYVRAKKKEPKP